MTNQPAIDRIYTDGACSGNPGPGGWGVVVYFQDGSHHELGGADRQTTNNQMELKAAIAGLQFVQNYDAEAPVSLHTDSKYVKDGITQWVRGWKHKGWKTAQGNPVLNRELWQQLDRLNSSKIDWQYVPGHSGDPGNDRCDAIARAFALGKSPTLHQGVGLMQDSPETPPLLEATDGLSSEARIRHLRQLIEALRIADEVAGQGYLITSAELADLMNVHASAVTSRGDQWTWRNWLISRVRREGNQILWQLERISELS